MKETQMSKREQIKQSARKYKTFNERRGYVMTKNTINNLLNTCKEENVLSEDLVLCEYEACKLFKTNHCNMWEKVLKNDKELDDEIMGM